jgi:hypothetical protein
MAKQDFIALEFNDRTDKIIPSVEKNRAERRWDKVVAIDRDGNRPYSRATPAASG